MLLHPTQLAAPAERRKVVDTFIAYGVADKVFYKEMFFTDQALAGGLQLLCCPSQDTC